MDKRKSAIQATFNQVCNAYDGPELKFFVDSAKAMVDFMNLTGSEKILDVATGTGHVALEMGKKLQHGSVLGIDFSSGMLETAKKKIHKTNLDNVDFEQMDMETLAFSQGSFDHAVCSFGIFFVSDMEDLLRKIASSVNPGGKITVSTFSHDSFSPFKTLLMNQLETFGVNIPPMPSKHVETEEQCVALFEKAGIQDVTAKKETLRYFLKESSQWWDLVQGAAWRSLVNQLSPKNQAKFKKEHLAQIDQFSTEDGIPLNISPIYTSGICR